MNIKLDNTFLLVFFVFLVITAVVGAVWATKTERRLRRFFGGKKAKDLEENIFALEDDITKLKSAREKVEKQFDSKEHIRKIASRFTGE